MHAWNRIVLLVCCIFYSDATTINKKDSKNSRELSEDDMRIDDILHELQGKCIHEKKENTIKKMKKDTEAFLKSMSTYRDVVKLNKKLRAEIKWIIRESKGPKEVSRIVKLMKRDVRGVCSPPKAKDCTELKTKFNMKSGVYTIYPGNDKGFKVYCDMDTDGGGWTVFQSRKDGKTDFYRGWTEYKSGFGDVNGEFWLGNDHISKLTSFGNTELRVDLESKNNEKAYAKYSKFLVGDETTKYKLTVSGYSGNAGDSLSYNNGEAFSTKDSDNDSYSGHCAVGRRGAWWYKGCTWSNLNGPYNISNSNGAVWYNWKNKKWAPCKTTRMMIRRQ